MSSDRPRILSRATTIVVVIAAHAVVVWTIWRLETLSPREEIDAFTSTLIWLPAAGQAKQSTAIQLAPRAVIQRSRAAGPAAESVKGLLLILPPPPFDANGTITLPSKAAATVDWSEQLSSVAKSVLDQERLKAIELGALTHRYMAQDDPRNPHAVPATSFRWYDAGIHRIDTRSVVPVLHVNDRCALVAFIMPVCLIGHIEIHGDLFKTMASEHENDEATARPNDAP